MSISAHDGPVANPPRGTALPLIRAHNAETNVWPVVLDDDPTGSQAVHDVAVNVEPTADDLVSSARDRRPVFVWTNSRSLPEEAAAEACRRLVRTAIEAAGRAGARPVFVSRSDSTLRGHFQAELRAILTACRDAGRPVDGVVFAPAYPEAGRYTEGDVQWVVQPGGRAVPAARTEFARDPTFGYREEDLRKWVASRAPTPARVCSISLDDLRHGGAAVRILGSLSDGAVTVANARTPADLEALALACQAAERAGRRFVYRTGPSFVRALAGQPPRGALTGVELLDHATAQDRPYGLSVVGSHTALTSRQLAAAVRVHGLTVVELDVDLLLRPDRRRQAVDQAVRTLEAAVPHGHAGLVTSRTVRAADHDRQESLAMARRISDGVCEVVARLSPEAPLRYVIAKGGITSHEVAVHGLGMRRASVLGQLFPGRVSALRLGTETRYPGVPYVIFPGNVGGEDALARAISMLERPGSAAPA
ncbi:four-carbon acid sugar kinase family protein [Actinomadura sp. WMMA1423]|uniref:four-carbon acid sugar kinase family protein n=1 Tax=Actinomadura sp. WMMA1423 TaxID=2591108 RepID=UPI001146A19E|nr:four-carbon acid sugar kinase family protein [Actinomadura sp. WMMA1423]